MIGRKEARKIVDFVCKVSKADQVEVVIFNYTQALTRFANNYIHQNVKESNTSISIRSIFGKKIGSAATNSLDFKRIEETVHWAEDIASLQKENNDFANLPKVKTGGYRSTKAYYENSAALSNLDRARAVAMIISVAKGHSLTTFGAVSNGAAEISIGNSLGTFAYTRSSDVFCSIVMAGNDSTGYSRMRVRDADRIDYTELSERAARKALKSSQPIDLAPGRYTTIFEPLATSEFLNFLGYYAFNGKLFHEGRSCLSGKLGKKICDQRVTIIDDPFDRRGFTSPFDFEGVPKKRLVLINGGVAKNVVYDSMTATKARKQSTGHAMTAPNPFGPIPVNVIMEGGDESFETLIKKTKRGILVTRFHYTNIIDPYKLLFTGMTRDGTFLIEDGEVTKGLKNMRFTENIIDVLNRLEGISDQVELVGSEPGYGGRFATGDIVPAVKVSDFAFTGTTEF